MLINSTREVLEDLFAHLYLVNRLLSQRGLDNIPFFHLFQPLFQLVQFLFILFHFGEDKILAVYFIFDFGEKLITFVNYLLIFFITGIYELLDDAFLLGLYEDIPGNEQAGALVLFYIRY